MRVRVVAIAVLLALAASYEAMDAVRRQDSQPTASKRPNILLVPAK